ncbi:site-specific tyrosine recombinase XerD [Cohnella faecalis]|uniref:Tyrosine recombinase XerC n=1 Tax=Cohnella faecalis TaxID=2315694 RepID=A0A398CXN0_9BACL|nr:site-specific tyrosine recombinase XerD [Cohnella faecalis]RIE04547.1 site-specific tyrosine recombinase XerD [Cohnella faecalis]
MKKWLQAYSKRLEDERNRSAATVRSYVSDLNDFIAYAEEQGVKEVRELRSNHIQAYLSRLKQEGRKTATIARRVVSLKKWFRFLTIERAIEYDPTLQIESPKPERKAPLALKQTEMDRLLESIDPANRQGLRDRAMLELLYATGLRVSELIALNIDHVRLDMGFLTCTSPGGRERMVPVGSYAASWVERYAAEARPQLSREDKPEQALFLNVFGERMTRQGFWKTVKKAAGAAGIGAEITPHTLRHSFAAHLVENGADLRAVQEMLGHTASASTQIYQTPSGLKVKDVYDRAHPRARS